MADKVEKQAAEPAEEQKTTTKKNKDEKKLNPNQQARVDELRRLLLDPDSEKLVDPHPGVLVLDEKEHHIGDFVIAFGNPDHPSYDYKDHCISIEDAVHDFDSILNIDSVFPSINLENELLRIAFLQAFVKLEEVPADDLSKYERVKRIKFEKGQKRKAVFIPQPNGRLARANIHSKKPFGGGGYLRLNQQTSNWERTGRQSADYGTLFRIAVVIKLTKMGGQPLNQLTIRFFIRQFLSGNGEYIFLVLYQESHNLLAEAERISLNVQVGVCNCDLLSLEPIGTRYRPLRLAGMLRKNIFIKDPHIRNIKPKINQLMEDINYRKLYKEIGLPPYESTHEILCELPQSRNTWLGFALYLTLVKDGVTSIREKYNNKSSLATLNKTEIHELIQSQMKEFQHKKNSTKAYVKQQGKDLGTPEGINLKMLKAINKRKMSQEYQQLFIYALREAQKKFSDLRCLWDYCGLRPLSPFVDFFNPGRKQPYNALLKQEQIWERSVVNSRGKHEIFIRMERQKLCSSILEQVINLEHLKGICEYALHMYIPNNPFDLRGEHMEKFVEPVNEALRMDPTVLFSYHAKKNIKHFYKQNLDANIKTQILSNSPIKHKKLKNLSKDQLKDLKNSKYHKIRGGLNGKNLRREWGIFSLPIQQIRDYFGERIALYFRFLGYYTGALLLIGLVSVPAFLASITGDYGDLQDRLSTTLFAFFILLWSSVFNISWQNQETKFAILYGTEDLNENETELIGFRGQALRSIASDKLNDLYQPEAYTWIKFFMTMIWIVLFMIAEVVVIVYLLQWSLQLEKEDELPWIDFFDLNVVIPTAVWLIMSLFVDEIFKPIAFRLTKWENHKFLSTFETSYISKILIFSTMTRLGQPMIIAFVSTTLWGCVEENECFQQLQVYMRIAIFMQVVKNVLIQLLLPTLRYGIIKSRRIVQNLIVDDPAKMFRKSPFYFLNQLIEAESDKQNFSSRDELDGTIDQQLDLVLQYGVLVNYGLPFPLVFLVAFFTNLLQMKIEQLRLLEYNRKPQPMGANTLGIFNVYLEFMTYLSIFVNSGLMTYTNRYTFEEYSPELLFIVFVFGFFAFKFFIDHALEGGEKEINDIKGRHQNIRTRIQQGASSSKSVITSYPSYPLLKPYGTVLVQDRKYKAEPVAEDNAAEATVIDNVLDPNIAGATSVVNPNASGQPIQPGQPINTGQPVKTLQPVQPVQPVQPGPPVHMAGSLGETPTPAPNPSASPQPQPLAQGQIVSRQASEIKQSRDNQMVNQNIQTPVRQSRQSNASQALPPQQSSQKIQVAGPITPKQ